MPRPPGNRKSVSGIALPETAKMPRPPGNRKKKATCPQKARLESKYMQEGMRLLCDVAGAILIMYETTRYDFESGFPGVELPASHMLVVPLC